jgi:hypothetical protein
LPSVASRTRPAVPQPLGRREESANHPSPVPALRGRQRRHRGSGKCTASTSATVSRIRPARSVNSVSSLILLTDLRTSRACKASSSSHSIRWCSAVHPGGSALFRQDTTDSIP